MEIYSLETVEEAKSDILICPLFTDKEFDYDDKLKELIEKVKREFMFEPKYKKQLIIPAGDIFLSGDRAGVRDGHELGDVRDFDTNRAGGNHVDAGDVSNAGAVHSGDIVGRGWRRPCVADF